MLTPDGFGSSGLINDKNEYRSLKFCVLSLWISKIRDFGRRQSNFMDIGTHTLTSIILLSAILERETLQNDIYTLPSMTSWGAVSETEKEESFYNEWGHGQ